jgi:hypothetical protein
VNSGFSLYFQMTILFVVCRAVVDSMAVKLVWLHVA